MGKRAVKTSTPWTLDWDDVRYLLAIARAGSISRAADDLGVDHATLSRRAARIEKAHGAKLFERSAAGVTPTAAAEALVRVAREAEEKMLHIERHLRGLDDAATHVRLESGGILATAFLSAHFAAFTTRHAGMVLELSLASTLAPAFRSDIDVALRLVPPDVHEVDPRALATVIGSVGWAAYVSANGHVQSAIHYTGAVQPGRGWLAQHVSAEPVALAEQVPAAAALVEAGCGVAVLPCFYADSRPELRQLSPVLEKHRLVVTIPAELRNATRVRAVVEWLRRAATRDADRLAGGARKPASGRGRRAGD